MGLSDELNKYIPKNFGKKNKKPQEVTESSKSTDTTEQKTNNVGPSAENHDTLEKVQKKDTPDTTMTRTSSNNGIPELPISHHIKLSSATSKHTVSSIAWDTTGTTIFSGTHGGSLHLWDLNNANPKDEEFRTIYPYEQGQRQQIRATSFNSTNTHLLVCSAGDSRPKILNGDTGRVIGECKRGDMYVMDMRRTMGHIAPLNNAVWAPNGVQEGFITAASDSTVRLWDAETFKQTNVILVVKSGGRVSVTDCQYSLDGRLISTLQQHDGTLALWNTVGPFQRPALQVSKAHGKALEMRMSFLPNGTSLISRASDGMVKLWDIRKLKTSLAEQTGFEMAAPESSVVAIGSAGQQVLVGMDTTNNNDASKVGVLDSQTLEVLDILQVPGLKGGVVGMAWHSDLNQIAIGTTEGSMVIYYDKSNTGKPKGGELYAYRKSTMRNKNIVEDAVVGVGPIITPHALPLFREESTGTTTTTSKGAKRRREDKMRSKTQPLLPATGHGSGGNIGVNATQHIMKSIIKDTTRDEDPREVLLRYAKVAEENPMFIGSAYRGTQDTAVFDQDSDENNQIPAMKRRK